MKLGLDYIPVRPGTWTLFVRKCPMKLAARLLDSKAFMTDKELVVSTGLPDSFTKADRDKITKAMKANDEHLELKIVKKK